MSSLLDLLGGSLDADAIDRLGRQIGASPRQTESAVGAALPLLLGALQRNAASPGGAMSLAGALDRDHDGSILDDVAGFFGTQATGSDLRSLDHIFGGRRDAVQGALGRASGLQSGQVMQLLAQLAPLVLAALTRVRANERASGAAPQSGSLGDVLGGAVGHLQGSNPGLGGLLGGLLDADGDGSVVDDLMGGVFGGGGGGGSAPAGGLGDLLGGLLGGKRG